MATSYSNLYRQNSLKPLVWEPVNQTVEHADITITLPFSATVPVGTVSGDIIKLVPMQLAIPTASPQNARGWFTKAFFRNSANVGGSMTANLGFTGTNSGATATVWGSALTTLQSATTLTIADNLLDAPIMLVNDELQLVMAAAGPTTTVSTFSGYVQFTVSAP